MRVFKKIDKDVHRKGLLDLYKDQLPEEPSTFMREVLKRAIRYLENVPEIHPKKIERWVSKLERDYRRGPNWSWKKIVMFV